MDTKAHIDELWELLGPSGRYQKLQITFMMLIIFPVTLNLLSHVFIGYTPPHHCRALSKPLYSYSGYYTGVEDNSTDYSIHYGKCTIDVAVNTTNGTTLYFTLPCIEGYDFETDGDQTIVTEWNLVCSRAGLAELSMTLFTAGQAIGAILFTSLSDRYGRKPLFVSLHLCIFVITMVLVFVPTYPAFAVIRFFIGSLQSAGMIASTFILEIMPTGYRSTIFNIGGLVWSFAVILLTPAGYFLRNYSWRYVQVVIALTSFNSLFGYWFVDESLRWLIANNKREEAIKLVQKAAKWNKVNIKKVLPALIRIQQMAQRVSNQQISETAAYVAQDSPQECLQTLNDETTQSKNDVGSRTYIERYTILKILQNKILLKISLILCYSWCVISMTYYGLYFSSSSLTGNRFLNYFLNALVEVPSTIIFWLLINRIGRKKTSIIFHAISGFSLIISVVLIMMKDQNTFAGPLSSVFSFIGKFAITGSFSAVFLYAMELYPTNLRNAGLDVASTAGRIGGMAAPFASLLAENASWAPGVLFGSCCMLLTILTLFLPETTGRELPQTLNDVQNWFKKKPRLMTKYCKHGELQRDGNIIEENSCIT